MTDDAMKIMPVTLCDAVGGCQSSPGGYAAYLSSGLSRTLSSTYVASHALGKLEAARKKDIETHEANLPALEVNKAIVERVTAFMTEIGMPRSRTVRDTKSRSRYPKSVTLAAGWLDDLQHHVRTSDGFERATQSYESLKVRYEEYSSQAAREAEQKRNAAAAAEEAEKAARRANVELAKIVLRYCLDEDADWSDVLEALRGKHQRIDLAIAMMDVRGDWNDGPDAVSYALDRFKIVTDEDKEIANDILSCLRDFDDGRVFRDTSWNYNRLMSSVEDQQLVTDVTRANELAGRNS
jgi:hypothetical protein